MRCRHALCTCVHLHNYIFAPNYINLHQITFHFIIYYYKNVFSIVFRELALRAAK
jgi:hypothetical protein